MPRRVSDDYSNKVTWLGKTIDNDDGVDSYSECVYNEFILKVNDFVLVSNPDKPSHVKEYDVVQIKSLYEILDPLCLGYKNQAVVESYRRPSTIPDELTDLVPDIDWEREVILNPVDTHLSIPIHAIVDKCRVMFCEPTKTVSDSIADIRNKHNLYVCRYKIITVNGQLSLVAVKEQYANKSSETTPTKRIVSPIKIINKSSVQKVAKLKQHDIENILYEPDGDLDESPSKASRSSIDNNHNSSGARRNLNSSLNDAASSVLMGSIIDSPRTGKDELKMTIKVMRRKNSNAITPLKQIQFCDTELDIMGKRKSASKRKSNPDSQIVTSPPKTPKSHRKIESYEHSISTANTPKGILKSLYVRLERCSTTPRRSISFDIKEEPRRSKRDSSVTPPKKQSSITSTKSSSTITPSKKAQVIPQTSAPAVSLRRSRRSASINQINLAESPADVSFGACNDSAEALNADTFETPRTKSRKTSTKTPNKIVNKTPTMTPRKTPTTTPRKTPTTTPRKTPSRTPRSTRVNALVPIIDKRKSPINKSRSDVQLAKESLHVSAVPKSLPCRKNEFDNVYSFIESNILDECGGCMYISGVPGTGKTATITEVIRSLQLKVKQKKLPSFEFVEVNGMRLTEPRQAYVQIYRQLKGQTIPWEQACSLLEKRFKTPVMNRKTTVLLVDELDMLCNRRQDVVYNLLDWSTKKAAQLVVITIANTMDLPERVLMGRVASRLGLTRLTFEPYTYKQLQEVVQARLMGTNIFNSDAVQMVAKKVASMSGDCRRALDICRRATEIAETDCGSKETVVVAMTHVLTAFSEMITNPKVLAIKNCSKFEQLFLQAVEAEVARTGVDETTLLQVYQQYESICALNGVNVPEPGAALRISSKLGSSRLLICEHSRAAIHQKIMLNVSKDDIYYALHMKKND